MAGAIHATGLVKTFGEVRAVDGVDLDVPEGGVLGLLGPNGAGKTTTVRLLTTLLRPDAGTATVAGHDVVRDPDRVRLSIGLSGQFAAVDDRLTGRENLRMIGELYGLRSAPPGSRRTNCWTGSTWPRPPTACRAPTRAACGGDSTWPGPSWSGPR